MVSNESASFKWLRAMVKGKINPALIIACIDIVLMWTTFEWQPDGVHLVGMYMLLGSFYCCVIAAALAYLQANDMGGSWIKSL